MINGEKITIAIWTARWEEIGDYVRVGDSRVTYTRRVKIISRRRDKRLDDAQGTGRGFSCASLLADKDCSFQYLNHCLRTNWRR